MLSNLTIFWSPDWRIASDEHQWIVQKRGHFDKKANAYYWRPKGFYHDLCKAIGFIVQRQIRALPVDIPADPGCQLILELENKVDQQLEALCLRLHGGAESSVTVADIADAFRPWAKANKIKPENMAKAFLGFCKTYGKNKGPA